jgi:hypothetical protein
MLAGVVVALPRRKFCVCGGCRRVVPEVATVTLDLPNGGYVYVCWQCYMGEPLLFLGGVELRWTGECWVIAESVKVESEADLDAQNAADPLTDISWNAGNQT